MRASLLAHSGTARPTAHSAQRRAPLRKALSTCHKHTLDVRCSHHSPRLPPPRAVAAAPPAAAAKPRELESITRDVAGGKVTLRSVANGDGTTTVHVDASAVPDTGGLVLHWGVSPAEHPPHDWHAPPDASRPQGSSMFGDGKAVRSPLNGGRLEVTMPQEALQQEGGPASLVGIMVRNRDGQEEEWLHADDGVGDLTAALRPPPPPPPPGVRARTFAAKLAADEAGGSMNLFRRYCMVNDAMKEAFTDSGPGSAAVLLAWLRLSANRQLPWYEGGNYQGKDMAHVQKSLATGMAMQARGEGLRAHIARLALATLPRGGGDGDAIRMTILDLLRNNGIKEGHRPGIECQFLAQWHQKLHSNTTRDDIAIGEAYLHFLHGSGDWGDFWWFLFEHYGLTQEDLEGMKAGWRTQGITGPACHLPFLIPAVQHLLWVLKVTHSGTDLDTAMTMARGCLPGDLQWDIDDMLQNRDAWWVPGKIANVRDRLSPVWRGQEDSSAARSLLLLDVSLDTFFRTKMEGLDVGGMPRDDALSTLELVLANHCVTAGCTPEAGAAAGALRRLMHEPPADLGERWSRGWSAHAVAVLDTVSLAVGSVLDTLCELTQEPAEVFAAKCASVDSKYVANFGEEVARGHALFVTSALLGRLQSEARAAAGLGPWEIISAGPPGGAAVGTVEVAALADMQGQAAARGGARVVLSAELGGLEDVPPGVVAVLTRSPVDLLSHIAIRARNGGVLLATCSDGAVWDGLVSQHQGATASVSAGPGSGDVTVTAGGAAAAAPAAGGRGGGGGSVRLTRPSRSREWALAPSAFTQGAVGGKSLGVKRLADLAASSGYAVPPAFALPYGTFERALEAAPRDARDRFDAAVAALRAAAPAGGGDVDMAAAGGALAEVRAAVAALPLPGELRDGIAAAVGGEGDPLAQWSAIADGPAADDDDEAEGGAGGAGAWRAVKAVWASKWTERAFLSRRAAGIPDDDLSMAVLCMGLIPADYAFVLHTASPLPGGSRDEVFGEVVVGLGEVLVGNAPGRAYSFSARKGAPGDAATLALPSKLEAHFAPEGGACLIARSDSNGEDLEGFAGAGLYESHTTRATRKSCVDYSGEPLLWDRDFRAGLVRELVGLAEGVERGAGAPQDVEGCFAGGKVYLLQSRAQVM